MINFKKRKKPPNGSFLRGGLSKFGQSGPKQIVLYIGVASYETKHEQYLTEGKRLQLPLSYRQIQYITSKNAENF